MRSIRAVWEFYVALSFALEPFRDLIEVLLGAAISWFIANWYFKKQFQKQAEIDKARAEKKVLLSYKRLVHSYISEMYKKRLKVGSTKLFNAMNELSSNMEIYQPKFDRNKLIQEAGKQAAKHIIDEPDKFEDIPRNE